MSESRGYTYLTRQRAYDVLSDAEARAGVNVQSTGYEGREGRGGEYSAARKHAGHLFFFLSMEALQLAASGPVSEEPGSGSVKGNVRKCESTSCGVPPLQYAL